MKVTVDFTLLFAQCLLGIIITLGLYLVLQAIDEWKYAPWARRLRCKWYGHDYHEGTAQNIQVYCSDGVIYEYDFCQRCWEKSPYRVANNG